MINIDITNLNSLEKKIHDTLKNIVSKNENITINETAALCNVSASKISKYVKKLGFQNFKEYKSFFNGKIVDDNKKDNSNELERIKNYIDEFDFSIVYNFIDVMNMHEKIIFFGYGPSFICVEFFAYKLRLYTSKLILTFNEEGAVENLVDSNTIVIVFSTTGKSRSFEKFFKNIRAKGGNVLLVIEEYNTSIDIDNQAIIFLTNSSQDNNLQPYEKTRTVFFIFMEEIIREIMKSR